MSTNLNPFYEMHNFFLDFKLQKDPFNVEWRQDLEIINPPKENFPSQAVDVVRWVKIKESEKTNKYYDLVT